MRTTLALTLVLTAPAVSAQQTYLPAHATHAHASCGKQCTATRPLRVFSGDAPTLLLSIAKDELRTDPVRALEAARALVQHESASLAMRLRGSAALGRALLVLGYGERAHDLALRVLAELELSTDADLDGMKKVLASEAHTLRIRTQLRAGKFAEAMRDAHEAARACGLGDSDLRAAHAAALYRNQHFREAADGYWKILENEPFHVEALIRLGSGLLDARPAPVGPMLRRAVSESERGEHDRARTSLIRALAHRGDHPIALRVLGELAVAEERRANVLARTSYFRDYFEAIDPGAMSSALRRFFPDYDSAREDRRQLIRTSARPFGAALVTVLRKGGSHDLLASTERTTDAAARAWLRGTRTFDGRVWDDVRGIGGLCAATGIEALDEAREGGFQTLVHELAHQLHFHAMTPAQKARVETLYAAAKREGRFLDYYAASNSAEYFAQGFEAWYSLVKAPAQPVTHGHTRFELERRDPALAAFVRELAAFDPLRMSKRWLVRSSRAAISAGAHRDAQSLLHRAGGRHEHPRVAREIDRLRGRLECAGPRERSER